MGVHSLFSKHHSESPPASAAARFVPPNPDPFNFRINRRVYNNGWTALKVHYPGVTSYEGNKVLVVRGEVPDDLTELDPHFSEGGRVVARFEPTNRGWERALELI